jgi:hypothetical protein
MEARVAEHCGNALGLQIHAEYLPIGVSQDVFAQVVPDEAVDAKNQNVFQDDPPIQPASEQPDRQICE